MTSNPFILNKRPASLQATSCLAALQAANSLRMNVSALSASGSRNGRSQLGADFQPSLFSVICGRGKDSYDHAGNHHFRELASMFVARYARAGNKAEKSEIVSEMVEMIHQADGMFCKFEKGAWYEVGNQCAREKASALLRGMLYKRRSFSQAKANAKLFRPTIQQQDKPQTPQQNGQKLFDGIAGGYDSDDADSSKTSLSSWGSSSGLNLLLGDDENSSLEDEGDYLDLFHMDYSLQLLASRLMSSADAECTADRSTSAPGTNFSYLS
jgi:hypothetical protein